MYLAVSPCLLPVVPSPWISCVSIFAADTAEVTPNFNPRKASWKASTQLTAMPFWLHQYEVWSMHFLRKYTSHSRAMLSFCRLVCYKCVPIVEFRMSLVMHSSRFTTGMCNLASL